MGDAGEEEEEWPLAFAPGAYESERYVLLEVDDELLEALEAGTLVIQAPRDDADAVVCTVDKTFEASFDSTPMYAFFASTETKT